MCSCIGSHQTLLLPAEIYIVGGYREEKTGRIRAGAEVRSQDSHSGVALKSRDQSGELQDVQYNKIEDRISWTPSNASSYLSDALIILPL
jgi:hypothetical protein